jgi:DNA polymerase-3 subunit delta'
MIDELLLQPALKQDLLAMIEGKSHAVALIGASGSGKGTIARVLAASYLGKSHVDALLNEPYYKEVLPSGASLSIGIDAVRELQKFTSLKTTGHGDIRRVVLVEDAHAMTTEAQNALLKLLEEPPADTVIIMTADHQQHLLPTVNSRLQVLQALPPSKDDTLQYFAEKKYTQTEIERAYLLSTGNIGLMHAILADNTEHPLVVQIDKAKQLLGMKVFERLTMVDELTKQKENLAGLLTALKRISKTALDQSSAKGQRDVASRWLERLTAIHEAEAGLQRSANTKLLLTNLFLNL